MTGNPRKKVPDNLFQVILILHIVSRGRNPFKVITDSCFRRSS